VTIVILLVLVVVLWIVVLVPSAWRRRSERRGVGSIDHFHHQLALLEHAGPKLVTPAYRLQTAFPGGRGTDSSAVTDDVSRPKLVLLRQTDDEEAADLDGGDGCLYERVGVLEAPQPPSIATETKAELAAYQRQQARTRCTMLLRCLVGIVVSTAVLGAVPGLRLAWVLTGVSALSALALMGLIGYARELQAQRRAQRAAYRRTQWSEQPDIEFAPSASSAGYPGAWDEDYDFSERAAAVR
jgi:hypothetical protein